MPDSGTTASETDAAAGATLHSDHTFRAVWRQPEDVDRYLREQAEGRVLNVCAGQSPLGDVKVDADPQQPGVIPADMTRLPFTDVSFDTVLFDPPWKLGYYKRQRPFFECVRVYKPDGLILMNARWLGESENTVLAGPPVVRADDEWVNVSAIVPHRKQPGQTTLADHSQGRAADVVVTADVGTSVVTAAPAE